MGKIIDFFKKHPIIKTLVLMIIVFFLLMFFKKYFNKPDKMVLAASSDSYGAYIIHPLIVVGFTFLSEKLSWSPLARLAFVLLLAIPTCFLVARLIRKIPGVKRVL